MRRRYNERMKNTNTHSKKGNIWTKVLIGLVAVLIVICGVLTAAVFTLGSKVSTIADSFTTLENENHEIVLSDEETFTRFYQTLVSEIDQYGNPEETEQASAALLTQVFVKTMKDCTVDSVEYENDKIVIHVHGVAVPLEKINASLLTSSAVSAAGEYLLANPLNAIASAFGGEAQVKELVYGDFANQFLDRLKKDIMKMDVEPVYYTLTVRIDDGKWVVESIQNDAPALGQPDGSDAVDANAKLKEELKQTQNRASDNSSASADSLTE